MTAKERKQVAELMTRISDVVAGANRIDDTGPLWARRIAYARADASKSKLQEDIKRLIGVYVPIG